MTKLQLGLGVIVIAGLVTVWALQRQTITHLRAEADTLRQQLAELEQLRADNERLSGELAQANSGAIKEQLRELLSLRGEVGALRRQANELQTLRAQNEQLRQRAISREAAAVAAPAPTPPEVPPQDIFPKESWAYAGYATPEATMQSMLWAMTQTNRDVFYGGFSPETAVKMQERISGKDFAHEMSRSASRFSEFRIINREIISQDEMVLTLYLEGPEHHDEEKTTFRRINGEWKIHE